MTLASLAFDHVWMLMYHDPMFVDDRAAQKRLESIWDEILSLEGDEQDAFVAVAQTRMAGDLTDDQAQFLELVTTRELWGVS